MDISKIINISGKPSLYKLISQTRNGVIVQCLTDNRRFPISSKSKVTLIENISIYTTDGKEVSLSEIIKKIRDKEKNGVPLNIKENHEILYKHFKEILPNCNETRLYKSDLRKIYRWYNILKNTGFIPMENLKEMKANDEASS